MNNELYTQIQYRLIEQLSDSEKRYRELVENLREIVFKSDKRGCFNLLNKAWTATLGYEVKECLNRPIDEFLCAETIDQWHSILEQLNAGEILRSKEIRFRHQNTNEIWLELSARLESGEILGSLTDITERKQTQAALKEAYEALENQVRQLQVEISEREQAEATLRESQEKLKQQTEQLEAAFQQLKQTQAQLVQAEKMSGLGQLVAGIAHEVNNPINFIHGNLSHTHTYVEDLTHLINLYRQHYPNPVREIASEIEDIELDFILTDLPKLLTSMQVGTDRIRDIVLSLRNFSRLDEAEIKPVDIHEGIDSTLMILQSRLKPTQDQHAIDILKQYGTLPRVECYAGQLNQVFMNLLSNAIDALEDKRKESSSTIDPAQIRISTAVLDCQTVEIRIADNGSGMPEDTKKKIFDPFFTTKPIGKGTGLGLSITYQLVIEQHRGTVECWSEPGKGTEFVIRVPIQLSQL
jgi:PAS domain S-box-containing protein